MSAIARVETLKVEITSLSRADREQLMNVLAHANTKDMPPLSREQRNVLFAIGQVIDDPISPKAFAVFERSFLKSFGQAKFVKKTEGLFAYLDRYRAHLKGMRFQSLFEICIKTLATELREADANLAGPFLHLRPKNGVTATRVATELGTIPSVMNRAFPGYAEAGLLHMIVRS